MPDIKSMENHYACKHSKLKFDKEAVRQYYVYDDSICDVYMLQVEAKAQALQDATKPAVLNTHHKK